MAAALKAIPTLTAVGSGVYRIALTTPAQPGGWQRTVVAHHATTFTGSKAAFAFAAKVNAHLRAGGTIDPARWTLIGTPATAVTAADTKKLLTAPGAAPPPAKKPAARKPRARKKAPG